MCTARTPRWGWRGWGTVHFFQGVVAGRWGGGMSVGRTAGILYLDVPCLIMPELSEHEARAHTLMCPEAWSFPKFSPKTVVHFSHSSHTHTHMQTVQTQSLSPVSASMATKPVVLSVSRGDRIGSPDWLWIFRVTHWTDRDHMIPLWVTCAVLPEWNLFFTRSSSLTFLVI